jgi:glycosyltransferase involved in cell wall biosynthesis
MMTASVVITTKNRKEELLKAVESAMGQPKSGSNELRVTGAGRKIKISWT